MTSWMVNLKPGFVISSQSTWELRSDHVVCVICRYRNWSKTIRTTTLVKRSWDTRKLGAKPHASNYTRIFHLTHDRICCCKSLFLPSPPPPPPLSPPQCWLCSKEYNVNTATRGRRGKVRHFDQVLRSWPQRFYQGCRCKEVNILGLLFANLCNLH